MTTLWASHPRYRTHTHLYIHIRTHNPHTYTHTQPTIPVLVFIHLFFLSFLLSSLLFLPLSLFPSLGSGSIICCTGRSPYILGKGNSLKDRGPRRAVQCSAVRCSAVCAFECSDWWIPFLVAILVYISYLTHIVILFLLSLLPLLSILLLLTLLLSTTRHLTSLPCTSSTSLSY